MSKKIYNAFSDSFLEYKEGLSMNYKDVAAFCKENNINMDVIGFFDDIENDIDEWMHDLGVSYDNDTLYGIGFKSAAKAAQANIKAYHFDDFMQSIDC